MQDLETYIQQASKDGHIRSGIILGIRMVLVGLKELAIDDPRQHHRSLIAIVETDRCLTDVIQLMVGCRLANRTLEFMDFGKIAVTFLDLKTNRAIRVAAREAASQHALELFPSLAKDDALARGSRAFSNDELFTIHSGRVNLLPEDIPGYSAPRVICAQCGEGIAFGREFARETDVVRACAWHRYFEQI